MSRDISPLTTLFYSLDLFGRADPELVVAAVRPYFARVLCAADFPFAQDGTRRDDAFRLRQQAWYEAELASRGIADAVGSGPLDRRVQQITALLKSRIPSPAH